MEQSAMYDIASTYMYLGELMVDSYVIDKNSVFLVNAIKYNYI